MEQVREHAITFGESLKVLRLNAAKTQDQLAKEIKTTRSTVARWELDLRKPRISQLKPLAKALKVNLKELTRLWNAI